MSVRRGSVPPGGSGGRGRRGRRVGFGSGRGSSATGRGCIVIVDEIVELPGGYILGKTHMRGIRELRRVCYFGLLRP